MLRGGDQCHPVRMNVDRLKFLESRGLFQESDLNLTVEHHTGDLIETCAIDSHFYIGKHLQEMQYSVGKQVKRGGFVCRDSKASYFQILKLSNGTRCLVAQL